VCEDWFAIDFDHPFGFVFRERPESRPFPRSENDCFHYVSNDNSTRMAFLVIA